MSTADSFHLSIVLPTKKVFEGTVTEVVLPAHDGEAGILPKHENFVGILGTGPLKYIHQGEDFWLAISSGIYKVSGPNLTILAEFAERGEEIDHVEDSSARIKEFEAEYAKQSGFTPEAKAISIRLQRERARLEVYRRTKILN
jgi:F-type H+-transporting ATPase subunit epsilon